MSAASPIATFRLIRSLSGRTQDVRLDLAHQQWTREGPGAGATTPAARDLAELALLVFEIERRLPKRPIADRIGRIEVAMPMRDLSVWTGEALNELAEILHIQGNVEWRFDFSRRDPAGAATRLDAVATQGGAASVPESTLVLFSGGLDSTAGLATLAGRQERTLVFSFYNYWLYHRQQKLLAELGFGRHIQYYGVWKEPGKARRTGGAFNHRSFLFLALAAIEAVAAGIRDIYQFENGPLALAVPPSPLFRVTRHAHPVVQRRAADLFSRLLGAPLAIGNPFLTSTKGESVDALRRISRARFRPIVAQTESCWYLKATQVIGGRTKRINQACGACIPCLVRKSALGADDSGAAVDFTVKPRGKPNPVERFNVDAYLDFADRVLAADYRVIDLLDDAPRITARALLDGTAGLSPAEALALYRRFAKELKACFPRP
jgi:hypothetical protein